MDVNIIVLLGFCLFMVISLRFGYKKTIQALDHKIDDIRKTLVHAETQLRLADDQLRLEKEKLEAFEKEALQLKNSRNEDDNRLTDLSKSELKQMLLMRQDQADLLLDKLRIAAIEKMRAEASRLTIEMVEDLATEHLTTEHHHKINDSAIVQIGELLASPTPANGDREYAAKAVNE